MSVLQYAAKDPLFCKGTPCLYVAKFNLRRSFNIHPLIKAVVSAKREP